MELAANDRLVVKNILVQQVGFLGDASERAKDNTELLTLTAEMLDALKMIVLLDAPQKKADNESSKKYNSTVMPEINIADVMKRRHIIERELRDGTVKP